MELRETEREDNEKNKEFGDKYVKQREREKEKEIEREWEEADSGGKDCIAKGEFSHSIGIIRTLLQKMKDQRALGTLSFPIFSPLHSWISCIRFLILSDSGEGVVWEKSRRIVVISWNAKKNSQMSRI